MSRTFEIVMLLIGVGGLLWVFWVYYLEAKRCYTEDMLAQQRAREAQEKKEGGEQTKNV